MMKLKEKEALRGLLLMLMHPDQLNRKTFLPVARYITDDITDGYIKTMMQALIILIEDDNVSPQKWVLFIDGIHEALVKDHGVQSFLAA